MIIIFKFVCLFVCLFDWSTFDCSSRVISPASFIWRLNNVQLTRSQIMYLTCNIISRTSNITSRVRCLQHQWFPKITRPLAFLVVFWKYLEESNFIWRVVFNIEIYIVINFPQRTARVHIGTNLKNHATYHPVRWCY